MTNILYTVCYIEELLLILKLDFMVQVFHKTARKQIELDEWGMPSPGILFKHLKISP